MADAERAAPSDLPRDPYKDAKSLEFRFRAKRFLEIRKIIETILSEQGRAEILDLGGSELYWAIGRDFVEAHRHQLHFTVINLEPQESSNPSLFEFSVGDACDPALFKGRQFDLVHSNSVIEHVGDQAQMQRFADNTRRLGHRYYMQTPDFWFPYEPHFRCPGFQWLPASLRATLLTRMRLGFFPRETNWHHAKELVDSIRLLTTAQVAQLFPDAVIKRERVLGMSKSIMAIKA